MEGKRRLKTRSVVLTFDDGYLDNWIYVAPLLEQYGMKGVVYVTPEFVEPTGACRPQARIDADGKLIDNAAGAAGAAAIGTRKAMAKISRVSMGAPPRL